MTTIKATEAQSRARSASRDERQRTREWIAEYSAAVAENERRERQVAALYELWRGIPDTEPDRLLQRFAERVTAAMDAHTCSLLLRERGGDILRVAASVGLPVDVTESVTLLVGERIAGRVAASGQPILVNKDPNTHPLLAADDGRPADIARRPEVESALCSPLIGADGEIHGVLCLSRFTPATPFTEGDLRMFSLFAAQVGAVVAQARVVEDLTRAGQEAAQMEREMARTANLAALGQMAATVAHELRNPLSSIKGAAQFLLRECEGDGGEKTGMLRDFLSIVVEEVNGLGRLTTDLLEFARPTPPQRAPHDLIDVARAEIAFLRSELGELGVRCIREEFETASPATALVDAAQVGQALRNLLLNAAQAAAPRAESIPAEITVRLRRCDAFYEIAVEDNGPGVPAEVRSRLWEPFFTTKARGSGLGLAQVRRVIEAHGGGVSVSDVPGGGARFVLSLPAEDLGETDGK
jgi:signal transduction histidine kinase